MRQGTTTKIGRILHWFIPNDLFAQKELFRKARILIYVHFFIIFIAIILIAVSACISDGNSGPCIIVFFGIFGALLVFKKWGNFSISGNILALLPALGLIPEAMVTGGIYSDNMMWLYICPMLAFLFADKKWGVIWSVLIVTYHTYLLKLELSPLPSFQLQLVDDPYYFYASYLCLFLTVLGLIYIFKSGQDAYIRDLSKQRNLLMQQKEEIQQQADELRRQEQKLKKMNADLEQFAFVVSHDLREPLRTIGTYTNLIGQELKQSGNQKTDEYIYFVKDGAERLKKMISNVLDDIRNEEKDKKLINLNDIMPVVINNLSSTIREKSASINYMDLPQVMGYSTAYIQLFQNLISNSIKFQKEGELPKIQITASRVNGSHYIKVADNGIGIPQEHLSRIFTLGERAGIETAYRGHGIGLSTCKKIVDRFDGDILVDSEINRGTIFTIKLPRVAS